MHKINCSLPEYCLNSYLPKPDWWNLFKAQEHNLCIFCKKYIEFKATCNKEDYLKLYAILSQSDKDKLAYVNYINLISIMEREKYGLKSDVYLCEVFLKHTYETNVVYYQKGTNTNSNFIDHKEISNIQKIYSRLLLY